MPEFFHYMQQLVNGLTIGSTYALIAIGYTMVYGIIGMINFAHGEVYMIGSYVAFMALAGLAMLGIHSLPLLMIAGFAAAIVVTSAYGYSIERVAYRPLRNSNRLIPLISAIGMSIFLQNSVQLSQGSGNFASPTCCPAAVVRARWFAGSAYFLHADRSVRRHLLAMTGLTLFISRSRMGRACRACAEDMKWPTCWASTPTTSLLLTFVGWRGTGRRRRDAAEHAYWR
ncbi:branched-chain amino acid ABC transporter permease LivH, partial [Pseudomonas syringae pv. actinidiae]|nr:branched-chain amino acid ABC transporter permease LivH [Pseudomonas syringae pv. actinidiae]